MSTFFGLFKQAIEEARAKCHDTLPESEEKKVARDHLLSTYLEWADKATNVEDASAVYLRCIPGTEASKVAYEKWLDLCTCAREARDAYLHSREEDEESGKQKWLSFFPFAKDIHDPVLLATTQAEEDAYAREMLETQGWYISPMHSENGSSSIKN